MAFAEQRSISASPSPQPARTPGSGRQLQCTIAAVLVSVGLAGGLFALQFATRDSYAAAFGEKNDTPNNPQDGFQNWGTPDSVLVLTGEMHGYLQPCGCSYPQFGGLARRYNFIQSLKSKGWPIVALDLGDVAQITGAVADQRQLKYSTAMKALDLMGYSAVGIGTHEFAPQLFETLSNYSLNNTTPVVLAANLMKREPGELFYNLNVKSAAISHPEKGLKVGAVGMIGPSVMSQVRDPDAKFSNNNPAALEQTLIDLKRQKTEVYVLLYQGSRVEAENAVRFVLERHRQFPSIVPTLDAVLCLSEASEPPSLPQKVGNTMIVEIGHKGRYVGVVGVYGSGPQRRLKYQLAQIGEEYKEAGNPVSKLMESYAAEVKRNNFAPSFPRTKHPIHVNLPQAKYVGSETCGNCHQHAYDVWSKTAHAHAFDKLREAKNPGLREFDGECIKCHVVGFGYHTGYLDSRNTERINKKLEHVGCEVCHGPGSAHVNNPADVHIHALMNPYKTNAAGLEAHVVKHRLNLIDMSCQRCHDTDNDVHWNFNKWAKIIHTTPPANANPQPAQPAQPANGKEQPAAEEATPKQ